MGSSQDNHDQIHRALDAAFSRAEPRAFDIDSGRYVIFSDQHRGARNSADDFCGAEEAYNAALTWYFERNFTLIVLGDVEELWQEKPASVLKAYGDCLAREAKFHQAGRYLRMWGNHDDEWQYEDSIERHLRPRYGGSPLKVFESLVFTVTEGDQELGRLFLIHGHQGTAKSDRWSGLARLVVRYLYRPFQRLTGMSLDTPSKNWRLRGDHNKAMHAWAARQEKLVLITGHTHRPVFESRSDPAQVREQLKAAKAKLASAPADKRLKEQVDELAAELERVAQEEHEEQTIKPCYFNAGCCSFPAGDITGIEIDSGEIRLVHWPDNEAKPRPQVLECDSLRRVLDMC